jgi:mediator of RNA polymerase II transcription subunit 10
MVQVNAYDLAGRPTKDVLEAGVYASFYSKCPQNSLTDALHRKQLDRTLLKIHTTANHPTANFPSIPPELIQYVDNGRNPEIYTREFVELARRGNQLMKGKMEAFSSFRDVLAGEMSRAMPELRDDVGRVVEETGGNKDVVVKEEES